MASPEQAKGDVESPTAERSPSERNQLSIAEHSTRAEKSYQFSKVVAVLVVLVGSIAATLFLYIGVTSANDKKDSEFKSHARDTAQSIENTWREYERTALYVHNSCRKWREEDLDYVDFEMFYKYAISDGLEFREIQWVPNVTQEEREHVEELGAVGWNTVLNPRGESYQGFVGQEPTEEGGLEFGPRSEQPFYFPIHFGEPRVGSVNVAGYDLYSAPWEQPAILQALDTKSPALTGGFQLVGDALEDGFSVVLYHPGADLEPEYGIPPQDLATIVVNTKDLLLRAVAVTNQNYNPIDIYLYDTTGLDAVLETIDEGAEFLAGLELHNDDADGHEDHHDGHGAHYTPVRPISMDSVKGKHSLNYQENLVIGGRTWTALLIPSEDNSYKANHVTVIIAGILIFLASLLLAIWMVHNSQRALEMHRIVSKAAAEAAIVADLYPEEVRKRLLEEAQEKQKTAPKKIVDTKENLFTADGTDGANKLEVAHKNNFLTSEGIYGSKPIAQLHPDTTVLFANLAGFSAWSSTREPSQVFTLLETLYHAFDQIAKKRGVFKVETIGDCYVAVTGLPKAREDHAVVMAKYATACLQRMEKLFPALEKTLGPSTSDLACRFGLHSGPVTAGVLRGDKGKFQLFGETVNVASRMESSGVRNRIQVSHETADLLRAHGHDEWLVPRENEVNVRGKGMVSTFFLKLSETNAIKDGISSVLELDSNKTGRLISWNVEVFCNLLKDIVANRKAQPFKLLKTSLPKKLKAVNNALAEMSDAIEFRSSNEHTAQIAIDSNSVVLNDKVVSQLTDLVCRIAGMYRDHPFHNFEHASHMTTSVLKMIGRIADSTNTANDDKARMGLCEKIAVDPLIQFACAFSALIHDADHPGVSNATLAQGNDPLAQQYKNKSMAEQNSLDVCWTLLLKPEYSELRSCICTSEAEFLRLRSLLVHSVMATDMMDQELGAAREARWNLLFSTNLEHKGSYGEAGKNKRATLMIEYLIQASDICHTMQHWAVYTKWNERLFQELFKAFKEGRLDKDPSVSWYAGELEFFDRCVIPLSKKLVTSGVMGVGSDEFLNYAEMNRKEWKQQGHKIVQKYVERYENGNSVKEEEEDFSVSYRSDGSKGSGAWL